MTRLDCVELLHVGEARREGHSCNKLSYDTETALSLQMILVPARWARNACGPHLWSSRGLFAGLRRPAQATSSVLRVERARARSADEHVKLSP